MAKLIFLFVFVFRPFFLYFFAGWWEKADKVDLSFCSVNSLRRDNERKEVRSSFLFDCICSSFCPNGWQIGKAKLREKRVYETNQGIGRKNGQHADLGRV